MQRASQWSLKGSLGIRKVGNQILMLCGASPGVDKHRAGRRLETRAVWTRTDSAWTREVWTRTDSMDKGSRVVGTRDIRVRAVGMVRAKAVLTR